jgi:hypothetical protein
MEVERKYGKVRERGENKGDGGDENKSYAGGRRGVPYPLSDLKRRLPVEGEDSQLVQPDGEPKPDRLAALLGLGIAEGFETNEADARHAAQPSGILQTGTVINRAAILFMPPCGMASFVTVAFCFRCR